MKKSVALIVLNNFKNDSRVLKESISLQEANYKIQVLALHEKNLKEYEQISGIPVHRIKLKSKNWSKNKLVQILKYLEFVYKIIRQYKNTDIFHCNDLNSLPIGVIIKLFFNKNAKVVYDAHELETEVDGLSHIQKKIAKFLEKKLIKYADICFTVSNSIAEEYNRHYKVKPTVLFNAPNFKEFKKTDKFRETLPIKKESVIFLYQGGLSTGRGIELWLEAFQRRKDDKVVMVFMGYGELEDLVKEVSSKINNVFYHPAVSPEVILDYTAAAAAAVSYIYNSCLNYLYCMPNKLFEYAMVGLPIVGSNLKDMSDAIRKYNLGVITRKDTPEAINDAIDELLKMDLEKLRQNSLAFAKEFCWEKQEEKMIKEYKSLND